MAKRESNTSIDMDELDMLIEKLRKLRGFYEKTGEQEKAKLANKLEQELTMELIRIHGLRLLNPW